MERVEQCLRPLDDQGIVQLCVDYMIGPGTAWDPAIQEHIKSAQGFLILADEQYLKRPYIVTTEWPAIKGRLLGNDGAALFWLPVQPIAGKEDPGQIAAFLHSQQALLDLKCCLSDYYLAGRKPEDTLLRIQTQIRKWAELPGAKAPSAVPVHLVPDEDIKSKYLKTIRNECGALKIPQLDAESPRLPLKKVYVKLRADSTTLADRLQTRALYHELAYDLSSKQDGNPLIDESTREDAIARILRERGGRFPEKDPKIDAGSFRPGETVEEVFGRERVVVILGDPGSGKSVMCKYLASELSDFCLAESHTNEGTPRSWLGSPRLPILIRVARFAKYIDSFRLTGSLDSALFDFLGEQAHDFEATAGVPGIPQIRALCQKAVLDNRAVLLIDGLDEVVESKLRSRICIAVERFIGDYVLDKERLRRPVGEGNQVVITSRVTGYHLAPLRLETVSHFLIRPLDDAAVRDLCEHLGTLQYPGKRHAEFIGPELFRRLDERSAEDASLDRIKRNPLLLTVLFFYFKKERQLPASRAELYRKLVLDLARNWRLNERDRPPGLEDTDALAWERLRTELNKDENILSLLCRIAERVHSETEWAGRITRRDLETCVDGALREVGIFDTREPHGVVADCRDILFRLISQYMGILVELGQDIFGFIHLTFQEYLVGFGMIHDLASSGPEQRALELGRLFLDQMDDPRWKEPLLFAYGILALEKDTACRTKLFEVVRLH